MRIVDPILSAAMLSGNYTPVRRIIIRDQNTDLVTIETESVSYCKLDDLSVEAVFASSVRVPVVVNKTVMVYERGGVVDGVEYVVTSSEYVITAVLWDGTWCKVCGHLVPDLYYSAAADGTYREVIIAFCQRFGKTPVFEDDSNPRWSYQFYPDGKNISLQNAQKFFLVLRQKHFIFAADDGGESLRFFFAFEHVDDPDLELTGSRAWVNSSTGRHVQYLWRDETEAIHRTEPTFDTVGQLGSESFVLSFFEVGGGVVLAGTYPNGKVYRSTDWGGSWTQVKNVGGGIYTFVYQDDGSLLFGAGTVLYRSLDDGLTWSNYYTLGGNILALVNLGGGILLAGTAANGRIYRSSDYGATWNYSAPLGATWVHSLVNLGGGVVLAGVEGSPYGATWRSTDYGQTWASQYLFTGRGKVLALEYLGGGVVLAGVDGYVHRSVNGGLSWTQVQQLGSELGVYKLVYFGSGLVMAGTSPNGGVWQSDDLGITWSLIQRLGSETDVRALYALSNEKLLAGTGGTGQVYFSLNANAANYPIHNLGFMDSGAVEPGAYFQFEPSQLDDLPPQLDCHSGDYVRVTLADGRAVDLFRALVTEVFDNSKTSLQWRLKLSDIEWLANTAGGAMPSTIERVAAYTPLVTTNFDNNLDASVNNLQALAEAVDELPLSGGPVTSAANDFQVGDGAGNWITKTLAQTVTILRTALDAVYAAAVHTHAYLSDAPSDSVYYGRRNAGWTNLKTYFDTLYSLIGHTHSYLSDAPSDSVYYGRRNAAWTNLKTYFDTLYQAVGSYVTTARTISTTAPLSGGGDLSANRTLTISAATTSAAGSMSAADKTKLDGMVSPSYAGAVLASSFGITGAAGVYQDTGLSVSLPAAGVYRITADVRATVKGNAGTLWWIVVKLYNSTDAADVSNSERLIVLTSTSGALLENTAPIHMTIDVSAAKTIKLYAARNGQTSPTWTNSTIDSDANGRSVMSYQLIGPH